MFTAIVRRKLATDYGIRDIPQELLLYFVGKYRPRTEGQIAPEATCAFLVANEWQKGKSQPPIAEGK